MADGDRRRFARASGANVLGNAIKIVVEGAVGLVFGSVALLADAAHSVADLAGSIVVLVWGQGAFDDPDETHPHGHERIEPLAALFVGGLIALLGLSLLYESARGLVVGTDVVFHPLLLGALALAIVDMYIVYWYTTQVNRSLGSPSLEALAIDCRNDIYTSLAAAVGVIGVLLEVPFLDPVAGGLVSLLVIYQGVRIGRENVDYLVGAAPPASDRAAIADRLRSHPAVEGIHDLRVFYAGPSLEVEVHVEIDGDMTVREAHEVESDLVTGLRDHEDVGDAHVHLDPSGIGEWKDNDEE